MTDVSIDQLRVFLTVVETGSFSAAARRLARAQSAITYAIQKLEDQAGLSLFDRSAYRPQLNEAGRALLPCVQNILGGVDSFHAVAAGLTSGLEAELSIVVEAMFPMSRLVEALHELQKRYPSVQTRLQVESLGAARDAVLDGRADIGLIIPSEGSTDALVLKPVAEIELVVVAAPQHPLATLAGPLSLDDVKEHLQLVFSDRSTRGRWPDRGVLATRTWRLADLGAKHSMLLAGLGWGSMPVHIVADDLANGRLVQLRPAIWDGFSRLPRLPVVATRRRDRVLGIGGRWLFERLAGDGSRIRTDAAGD